jgi:DNA-binding transcriptional LysR family regulator
MNFNHLEIFHAVATEKNISKAAKRLLVSQPAVSKQLRTLEQSLKLKLADRSPHGIELTPAGLILEQYCAQIFSIADEAQAALDNLAGLRQGRLSVGASTTIGIYFLPQLLARYRKLHPKIELVLEVANTDVIQQYLAERRVDVALTEGFIHRPNLSARVFHTDLLLPIAANKHPFASQKSVSLEQFVADSLLMREEGSGTREVIEDALLRRNIVPKPLMTLGHTEAIKRAVAAGVGVAFVSALAIQQELANHRFVVVPIKNFILKRSLHLVQLKNRAPSPATRAFLQLLP